jgi:hypothetical protein
VWLLVIFGGYYKISTNSRNTNGNYAPVTEIDKLLAKDVNNNYPGTSREVLKLYGRMIKCFYNDGLKENQIDQLADQMRLLFDEELLGNNPKDEYLKTLKVDINDYIEAEKSITSYTVEKSSAVVYKTVEEREYATIKAEFLVKEKSKYKKTYEEFILRQDKEGKWRILGWKTTDASATELE